MTSDFCYFIYDDESECGNPAPYYEVFLHSGIPDDVVISCAQHVPFFIPEDKNIKVDVTELPEV